MNITELADRLENPQRHDWWGAGEPDCPSHIKAPNGELHTMMCKRCGAPSPKDRVCQPANLEVARFLRHLVEPTPAMIEAGRTRLQEVLGAETSSAYAVEEVFRAMLEQRHRPETYLSPRK